MLNMNKDYERGYFDAIEDVEKAMKAAGVNTLGPAGFLSYNDPKLFVEALRRCKNERGL